MTLLNPQNVQITGLAASYSAVTSTDTLRYSDRNILHVKNGGGGSINVTVVVPGTLRGQAIPDVTVAVPAGTDKFIGPFDLGEAVSGTITVTYSGTTTVTAALLAF